MQVPLGHESIATTERYTAVDDGELRAAMIAAAIKSRPECPTLADHNQLVTAEGIYLIVALEFHANIEAVVVLV